MPTEAIADIIRIITSGRVREEWALLVRSLFEVGIALVDLVDDKTFSADPADEAKIAELESTLNGFHAEGYGASTAEAIDPATIMVIVQLVLTLIEKLRKK